MRQDSTDNERAPAARRTQTRSQTRSRTLAPAGRDRARLALVRPTDAPPKRQRGRGARRRRGLSGLLWLAVVPVAILIIVFTQLIQTGSAPPARPRLVVASLPYWNIGPGTDGVLANRDDVNEVSPWIYGVSASGQIILDAGINLPSLKAELGRLRAQGLPIVPTLANVDGQGNWTYGSIAGVLHNPARAARQIAEIVSLTDANNYAGIDLDYENLQAGDRQAFTAFVTSLAAALHAKGKILSVALFAKASNAGYAPRNVAQDYAAIGRVADQVRLMAYDYHWNTSPPGPVAPIGWIRDVVNYAKTQMPASKIVLGIPEYGYDWSGGVGTSVTWLQVLRLSRQYHVQPRYDAPSQSPWFTYTDRSGHKHTVWFENAESAQAKFEVAQGAGIAGVYLWMYGYEDPGTWAVLHQVLPIPAPSAAPDQRASA
jgi:spore germination protein